MPGARREKASHQQHKEAAPRSVSCMVITCSDTRTPETDTSGALIMNALKDRGHSIASYHLVKDEPSVIRKLIKQGAKGRHVQAIIVNGGTGISRRDSTFETIDGLLEKRLNGIRAGRSLRRQARSHQSCVMRGSETRLKYTSRSRTDSNPTIFPASVTARWRTPRSAIMSWAS